MGHEEGGGGGAGKRRGRQAAGASEGGAAEAGARAGGRRGGGGPGDPRLAGLRTGPQVSGPIACHAGPACRVGIGTGLEGPAANRPLAFSKKKKQNRDDRLGGQFYSV